MRKNSASGFQNYKELEMLFQNSFDALLLTGRDGKIYWANSAAEELFGYTAEELCLLGRIGLADLSDPNWPGAIEERARTGKFIGVLRCRKKDGKLFYCEVASRIFNSGDGSMRASTSVRDVTDRIESEKKLRAAHRQLQEIIDGSPTVIFVKDLQGRLIIVNKKFEDLFGLTREELKGKKDSDIFPKEWIEYFRETDETPESGRILEISEQSDFSGGVRRHFFLNKFLLLDENSRPYALCGIASDISKTMEAERRFLESRKGLIEAQRLAHIGNWYWDIKSDTIQGSDEIFRIYGLDPAKDTVPTLAEQGEKYFSPENFEVISSSVRKALETGEGYELDVEILRNGSKAWITNRVEPIKDQSGRVIALSGTIQDFTERKLIEQQLELQGRLLETIVLNVPSGIAFIRGRDLVLQLANEAYQAIVPGKAITGRKFEEVWPEAFPFLKDIIGRVLDSGEPYHAFDAAYSASSSPDGPQEERYFNFSLIRIHLPGKDEWGILNTVIETTDYVRANRSVINSETKLREAQKLAHMGSFTFDASTGMLEWMDEVFNIFERDPEKGHPSFLDVLNYVHPDDREYVNARLDEAQKYKKALYMEYRIITDKGNLKYLRYIGNPIFDGNGSLVRRFGTVLDITESKTAELKLKTTLRNLERSNRELEQFAYIASHDLQEPLRMVSNFARLLAQRYQDHLDEKANEFITFMIDGTKRMQNLISDLLQYARLTTKAQPFVATDMNQIMDYVAADLRMAIDEKNAYLNYDRLPEINADPIQMRQLMQNLVANAIKFKGDRDPEIYIEGRSNEKEWVFCVRDNGIGISPEYHDRIFIIFQRLHEREKYAGTGIGLALCKKIVERHGGRIWVESEEGRGSSFYFTIPFGTLQY